MTNRRRDPAWRDGEWPDDDAAQRLREVLAHEARAVTPSPDGLAEIRRKIAARRATHRQRLRPVLVSLGAAAATAAIAIVAIVVVPSHNRGNGTPPTGTTGPASPTTPAPSSPPASIVPSSPAATHPVTIYYVGKLKDPQQLLYRETVMRPPPAGNAFIGDAVTAMLSTAPDDPDYTSYWPGGTTLLGATIHNETTAVIDLSAEAANGPAEYADISLQQLLYTIKAAWPQIDAVELHIAGKTVDNLWGTPITQPVQAKQPFEVFAHVWILYPKDHATVPSVVTFGGDADTFEATVNWDIRTGADQIVAHGSTLATAGNGQQGTWSVTKTLQPGTYTIHAYEISAKDGSITYDDDKVVTVQ
jgi:spore germination protein GerM